MNGAAGYLNALSEDGAREALLRCCGSTRWADAMLARLPLATDAALLRAAEEVWSAMEDSDILEALSHHPEIGSDLDALRERFASTAAWAEGEQAGVQQASEATLLALRDGNAQYRARFAYTFVICATGHAADQMLAALQARLPNAPEDELRIAAAEQAKITRLRLEKIV